jgi:hypothetical protein
MSRRKPLPLIESLEPRRLMAMVGYWKLNESAGTLASDSGPAAVPANLVNGPTWTSGGISAGTLALDGVDDHAQLPATLGSSPALSIAFWFNASSLKHQVPIDKMPLGSGGAGWNIKLRSDGSIWFRVGSDSAFNDLKFSAGYTVGTWVHVAATYASGVGRLFVNGTLRATATGLTRSTVETATPLRFGQPSAAATTETFHGRLDDIRLYDHSLSSTEVSALATQNSGLAAAVNALPNSTQQLALKKATLAWALEDATTSLAAGLTTIASDTYDDVRTLLPATIGNAQTAPANLFPNIRNFSTNPIATGAMSSLTSLRNGNATFTKTPTDLTPTMVQQGRDMAWGLMHPQSTLKGDSTLLTGMLRRFQKTYEANLAGTYDGDFMTSPNAAEMFLMFRTVYPDLILPSRKAQWEQAIRLNADVINAADGNRLRAAVPGTSWVNADVRRMNALRYAYELFGTPIYLTTATATLQLISHSLLPDGGYLYDQLQNEVYTYHGENITALARYWQITGETLARDLIIGSYWYYPLSVEPNGTAEYSSGSSWKHYWNQVSGSEAAYIVADLANSRENLRVAQWTTPTNSLFLATFFRPDLTPTPSPDNYIAYDRNVLGPRGRFGNFSFVGTASTYTNDNRGKSTHVGAMATDFTGSNNGWRLNSALDLAQSRVRFRLGPDDNTIGNDVDPASARTVYYDTAQQEKNAFTINARFSALTTSHRLAKYKGGAMNWRGEQQWLMLPDRMIGMVSNRSTNNQTAYSMVGSLRFVSGRGSWGVARPLVQVDANTFFYGKLTVDIHEQNYGTITTTYEDTWDDDATVIDNKSGRLNFVDSTAAATGETTLISYPNGTRRYYLVEIRPDTTTAPASSVTHQALPSGIQILDVASGTSSYRLVTNTTDAPLTFTITAPYTDGYTLHRAGEQFRPTFLSTYLRADTDVRGRTLTHTNPSAVTSKTITIPAQQHIVLVKSDPRMKPVVAPPNNPLSVAPTPFSRRPISAETASPLALGSEPDLF